MQARSKMAIFVGALALTATTLLAGCGGGSTDSAEPAAAESAAAAVPASITDGLVKPEGVDDAAWAATLEGMDKSGESLADLTPEDLAKACEAGPSDKNAARAEENANDMGGSVEEWVAVWEQLGVNVSLIACSLAE